MTARRYRRRPPEVEAMLYDGTNGDVVALWAGGAVVDDELRLPQTKIQPQAGEYVVRSVLAGGLGPAYTVKPEIFRWAWETAVAKR
jgi:hypothetical protein